MRNKSKRRVLKVIALGFAVAAAFTTTASGQPEIPYLSHGQGVDETAFADLANQSTRDGGPVFMNGVPDGYVGSGVESAQGGMTPTDLARAVPRYGPYGPLNDTTFVPPAEVAPVSAVSDGYDRDELAIGFGLGLILATACAAALLASRNRMRMAQA